MAAESTTVKEGSVNPINAVNLRTTGRFRTMTGKVNDAVIHRMVSLAREYAGSSPFRQRVRPRTEQEERNRKRIVRAADNMYRRNEGRYL